MSQEHVELEAKLRRNGFFKVTSADVTVMTNDMLHTACDDDGSRIGEDSELVARLARGVLHLVSLGFMPSYITVYDEAWELVASVSPLLLHVTGNVQLGDWYTFCIDGTAPVAGTATTSGWAPHRDRPAAGPDSFRGDGSPKYCTVWIPLTDATAEQSCLYFIPAMDDPNYRGPGDHLANLLDTPLSWQNVLAQPVPSGSLLCFSHRLVHWGSKPQEGAVPRIAMSFSFASPDFEAPYFADGFLPLPPVALRVGLVSGQQIMYNKQRPLSSHELALHNRIFMRHRHFFNDAYAEKIQTTAQFLKFMRQR